MFPPCNIKREDAYKFGHVIWTKPKERTSLNNVIKRYSKDYVVWSQALEEEGRAERGQDAAVAMPNRSLPQ